jgi:hypothetical protein
VNISSIKIKVISLSIDQIIGYMGKTIWREFNQSKCWFSWN